MTLFRQTLQTVQAVFQLGTTKSPEGFKEPDIDLLRLVFGFIWDSTTLVYDQDTHRMPMVYTIGDRRPDLVGDDFLLPRSPIAIEDPASVTCLRDVRPNPRGIAVERMFVDIQRSSVEGIEHFYRVHDLPQLIVNTVNLPKDSIHLVFGIVQGFSNISREHLRVRGGIRVIAEIGVHPQGINYVYQFEEQPIPSVAPLTDPPRFVAPEVVPKPPDSALVALLNNVAAAYALVARSNELQEAESN